MPGGHGSVFQLLELNLISARDLALVSKSMKPFAVVWINPDRKYQTRPDNSGQTDPTWNEKFVFRVDESSAVTVQIHAATRLGDVVLVGTVGFPVASLFPPRAASFTRGQSKMRFLTLQIRRPSGRPQGVLDVGVALLDGTRRSMPLSELSSVLIEIDGNDDHDRDRDDRNRRSHKVRNPNPNPKTKTNRFLRRSKSERSVSESYLLKVGSVTSTAVSESAVNYGKGKGSLCSDIGPSPSVVAAAIARKMYPAQPKLAAAVDEAAESSILYDWVEEDDSVEGLKTKIERWRSEIHPLYQRNVNNINGGGRSTYRKNETPAVAAKPELRRGGSGLFSCFGTAYGCEFSITCGGGNSGRRKRSNGGRDADGDSPLSPSELRYNDQYV